MPGHQYDSTSKPNIFRYRDVNTPKSFRLWDVAGTKYDVRATYPASHMLRAKQPKPSAEHGKKSFHPSYDSL